MGFFLANDQIKKELGITADQEKKLQALMPQRGQGGGPGSPESGPQMSADERRKQREELQGKIEAVLTPAQKSRIQQIQYQMMGWRAFTSEEVAKELGITADQAKKLDEISPQGRQPGVAQELSPEERQKRREERMAKAFAILTAAQRAKWEKMIGKPFEFQRG
jgi:hypothetical protein